MPRIPFALALCLVLWPASAPGSSIAKEPLLRVLRSANPAVRACADRHVLAPGRYVVWVSILSTRAREVRVDPAVGSILPSGRACLVAAYARLSYPEMTSLADGAPEPYQVTYPFVLAAETARLRPRPARIGITTR